MFENNLIRTYLSSYENLGFINSRKKPCIDRLSGMPKSERPKMGKPQKLNVWQFGFWHSRISNIRALKFPKNLSKNWTFRFWYFFVQFGLLRPYYPKSERFCSDFRHTILFGLSHKSPKRTFCPKTKRSVPFGLMGVQFSNRNFHQKSEQNRTDFQRYANTELSENGTETFENRTCSYFGRWLYVLKLWGEWFFSSNGCQKWRPQKMWNLT